ncbi:MAG: hypothetical protein JRH15_23145, partial [Deltaproteobacteria bacterium]|nr:hypothetical protein [Deltaproteobacteria bacterium]
VSIIFAAVSNRFYSLGVPVRKKQLIDALTEMFGTYMEALLSKNGD